MTTSTSPAFFDSVTAFAQPIGKTRHRDDMRFSRSKFCSVADEQIKLIGSDSSKGFWFKRDGDAVVITLKNGAYKLNASQPSFRVASSPDAIKFLEQAKAACVAGEFDDLFRATLRKVAAAGASSDGERSETPNADVAVKAALPPDTSQAHAPATAKKRKA